MRPSFVEFLGASLVAGALVLGVALQCGAQATQSSPPTLLGILDRFTAVDVPATGPAEAPAKPLPATKPAPTGLPGDGLAQHSMLFIGEGFNKIFLVDNGKVIWTYSTGTGGELDDVWMLSNANIVFSRLQYVAEVTPNKQVVWKYDAPKGSEIHCCQPIGLDKVLFIQNGTPPKLMVVNIKTGKTEVEHDLPFDAAAGVHGQFRRVRYTGQGTYLVTFLLMNQVVEYDKDFNEIWKYPVTSPWAAIRLKNGNTLITDEKDRDTLEVSPDKKIVWDLKPADLPENLRYNNTQSCTRLANGNTIICSRGGVGKPQLVEVTPDKKVVWVLEDWKDVGPATAVQILDDPGVPEDPGESLH